MGKKGKLEEILSKARFYDDPSLYKVAYRDFEKIVEIKLPEFIIRSDNFKNIPSSRIVLIKKKDLILYKKLGK